MRSRISGILLLCCLIVPCVLTYSWLRHQKMVVRKQVKKQMLAGLDRDELVLLAFSKGQTRTVLRWEHAGEFEFRGQMFDIVETEERGDSIFYRCWLDHAETKLNKQLSQLVSGVWENHPSKRATQKHLLEFFDSLFCSTDAAWAVRKANARHDRAFWHCGLAVLDPSFSPPFPPPKNG